MATFKYPKMPSTDAPTNGQVPVWNTSNADWESGTPAIFDRLSTLANTEVAITTTATATISKQHLISGTSSDYTVTLPAASGNTGKFVSFRISTAATKLFTIDGNSSEKIDGALTRVMWAGESATLYCDGSNWFKIAGKTIPMMANMYLNNFQTGVTNGNIFKVNMNTTIIDNTGRMADTSNYKIIAKRAGTYQFTAVVTYADNSGTYLPLGAAPRILAMGYVNGTEVVRGENSCNGANYTSPQFLVPAIVAAEDYFEIYGYQTSGATGAFYGSIATQFSVIEIPSW